MPVINVKMTHEDGGATVEQKEELVKGINELFSKIFNRSSSNAIVLMGPFRILCQLGKIENTKGHKYENRNRCRAIC